MFHDRARIRIKAGRGGDGGLSFRREKFVPKGGPDGGDGGRGGDVIIVADKDLRDLSSFRAKSVFDARRGGNGSGTRKHGADGADVVLTVPVGTQITNVEDGTRRGRSPRGRGACRARARGWGRPRKFELRDADAADAALRRDGDAGAGVRARASSQADGRRRVRRAAERRQVVASRAGSRMRSPRSPTIRSRRWRRCSGPSTAATAGS